MAGKIFINYRRGDEPGFALALYGKLEQVFPVEKLFMDVEGGIAAGDDFVNVLEHQVAECDVMLALMGQGWLDARDENGRRRLDNPEDFVRIEISTALTLGKRVIPVLLNQTEMPRGDELPQSLIPLARRNAVRLRQDRFRSDVQGLIGSLTAALAAADAARHAATEADRQKAVRIKFEEEQRRAELEKLSRDVAIENRKAGLSSEEIRKAEELLHWDTVKDGHDEQDIRDHLARFPGGITERSARLRLEAVVWNGLGSSPELNQLKSFIAEFPNGANYSKAAELVIKAEGKIRTAREAANRKLAETQDWADAANRGDARSINAFLRKWPTSEYAQQAQNLLANQSPILMLLNTLMVFLKLIISAIGMLMVIGFSAITLYGRSHPLLDQLFQMGLYGFLGVGLVLVAVALIKPQRLPPR